MTRHNSDHNVVCVPLYFHAANYISAIAVRSLMACLTAMGTHVPYGITQCYLPPGRADIPALTAAEAGTVA